MPDRMAPMASGQPEQRPPQDPMAPVENGVTQEDQALYTAFVENGLRLIYSPETMPDVLNTLQGDSDPVDGLANAAVMVVRMLEESAQQNGQQIDGDIVLQGGTELLEDMANLSEQAGIHEFTDEEVEGAFYRAMDLYRFFKQQEGGVDQSEAQREWAQVQAASEQGQLESMLPGASDHFRDRPDTTAMPDDGQEPGGGILERAGRR